MCSLQLWGSASCYMVNVGFDILVSRQSTKCFWYKWHFPWLSTILMRSSQISVSQLSKFLSKFQRPKNSELSTWQTWTHKTLRVECVNFVCDIFCQKHVNCKLNRCKIKCVVFMFISILYLTTYCEVQASKMAANFPDHPDTSQAVKNQLRLSENYPGRP